MHAKCNLETWDMNGGTVYREKFETNYWSGPPSDYFRMSQSGLLTGLRTPGTEGKLTLIPYSTNVMINPNFATVESDAEQINLTRYELSYPKKRVFFQEGNQMFSTRIQTFCSRRIGE